MIKIKTILFILLSFRVLIAEEGIFHVPFQKSANLIVVRAKVNGYAENFIFDTGAKTLVINSKYVEAYSRGSKKKYSVSSINGKISDVEDVTVENFEFANIHQENFKAIVLNMSLLEDITGHSVYGLIGYDVFAGYDICIDYQESFLTFIPASGFMDYWNNNIINRNFSVVDFHMSSHIPVVKALAGDKRILLGVDTGAAKTLIDKKTIDIIHYEMKDISEKTLVGIDNKDQIIGSGKIRKITVGDNDYHNIEILIKDLSHINDNISNKVDGLIGYDILQQHKTLISYKNQKFVFIE